MGWFLPPTRIVLPQVTHLQPGIVFVLALAVTVVFAAPRAVAQGDEEAISLLQPAEVVDQIRMSASVVVELVKEYEPTNDSLVLNCLKSKLSQLKLLEASVLASAAKRSAGSAAEQQAGADSAAGETCELFSGFCTAGADVGGASGDKSEPLQSSLDRSAQLEEEARACLRIDSGQVVDYLAQAPEPAPEIIPEVQVLPDPTFVEPSPVDRPLSGLERR